jgi:hypothetical protein
MWEADEEAKRQYISSPEYMQDVHRTGFDLNKGEKVIISVILLFCTYSLWWNFCESWILGVYMPFFGMMFMFWLSMGCSPSWQHVGLLVWHLGLDLP